MFFVSVASKEVSQRASLLFATLEHLQRAPEVLQLKELRVVPHGGSEVQLRPTNSSEYQN